MTDLILQAAGDIQAEGILTVTDNTALAIKNTILIVLGVALYGGAIVQAVRAKLSVSSIIVGLIMVAGGSAVLYQIDAIAAMFSDEIDTQNAAAVVQEAEVIALPLGEGPLLLTADQRVV